MRKITIALFALFLVLCLAACGSTDDIFGNNSQIGDDRGSDDQTTFEFILNEDGASYSVKGVDKTAESLTITATYKGKPVTDIAEDGFRGFIKLVSVTIEEGVKNIGEYAFNQCQLLESVTVPSSVQSIGKGAFRYSSLKSIILPDGLTEIEDSTFYGCQTLEYVVIPASVTVVREYAFDDVRAITAVYYKGTQDEWNAITFENRYDFYFKDAPKYFYSETQPAAEGNYWHYVEGVPTAW